MSCLCLRRVGMSGVYMLKSVGENFGQLGSSILSVRMGV